jgi:hypothetical protein
MNKIARLAGTAFMLASLALPLAARAAPGPEAAGRVLRHIIAEDCAGAVAQLKEGLANGYPEVNLLAGTLFDNGVCVKADWNKAVHFYVRAADGGQKAALYRLAAGFAAPEHGADVAAALWWASRAKGEFSLKACPIPDAALADPDRFVEELRSWPAQRVALCNYLVGVVATLAGEIRYPPRALTRGVEGDVQLRFTPAFPRVDLRTAKAPQYRVLAQGTAGTPAGTHPWNGVGAIDNELAQVAARALKRYPQPAGIAADVVQEILIHFEIED